MALKRAIAEVVGTFVLVFGGVGAAVIAGDRIGFLGVAFAFGLSLLAMAYAIGPISGCHINPAVTLGLLARGKIGSSEAVRYWAAQIAGAILAALVLLLIVKGRAGGYDAGAEGFGANGYGDHSPGGYSWGAAFAVEVVLTAFLVFTVLAATDKIASVAFAGIPIGLVLVLIHLVGIPVDNTSVNPARSIGPALFVGGWALEQLWLFIVAPLAGALLAAGLHKVLFADEIKVPAGESAVAAEPA
ncbi:aquaporin Z [Conexibacter arvalis]|uniref:Aquaporin Z n=1 Tax=Conexibacter arvalis TaxID=912552 RepID=A0A840ILX6_9ACTN|nr:aquaporin Z [Conexibacter arvalis]